MLSLPPREDKVFHRIAGTRLQVVVDKDESIEVRGPCGHSHTMTQYEAACLAGWLHENVGWIPPERAEADDERNAMLDAEIGLA